MKPDTCKGCPLYEKGEGYVYGEGPHDAVILLLGEALGAEEASKGRPFIGGAGRVLNALLQKAGIRRSECFVTNVVRCRPLANRTPTPEEIAACTSRHGLLGFIKRFNLVVALGNVALTALTGAKGISKWRGSILLVDKTKVLPTFHPAALMRQQDMFPIIVADLLKVGREGWTADYTPPRQDYVLAADVGHVRTYLPLLAFAFDVETSHLQPRDDSITLLGLSRESGTAHVLSNVRGALELPVLQQLFSSSAVNIAHNFAFDWRHLEANGIEVKPPIFDTMIANHIVLSDVPNDLGFVASLYTNLPYWKHLAKTNPKFYNATDVDATYRIYEHLSYEIKSKGMQRVFDTAMRVLPIFERMYRKGVRVDKELQLKWQVALNKKIRQLETVLVKGVGDPTFNWKSYHQLSKLLYGRMRLPHQYTRDGTLTTNEEALEALHELTGSKVVATLRQLRKLSKLESTYFTPPPTARVHSEYTQHVAANGRTSSRDPNLQNVPKGPAREIYIPDEGMMFTAADYNQIELRLSAILANETSLLEAFAKGEDIHRYIASEVYHVRMSEVTDHQRHRAKFIVYGLGYGRGAQSIAKEHKMSAAETQRLIDNYFDRFPRIKMARQDWMLHATSDGYLANPFGRRRYFFGRNVATKVYNFPPSSAAADILLESFVALEAQRPEYTQFVLTVHDQILVQHPPDKQKEVTEWLKDNMERQIDVLNNHRIPISLSHGKNWKEAS